MAQKVVKTATNKVAAKLKNAFSKAGSNPTNPAKGAANAKAANVVRAQNQGKGLSQNSVAAKLTGNSARGKIKKNLSPMVGVTKTQKPYSKSVVPSTRKDGGKGGFKSFIGGK